MLLMDILVMMVVLILLRFSLALSRSSLVSWLYEVDSHSLVSDLESGMRKMQQKHYLLLLVSLTDCIKDTS